MGKNRVLIENPTFYFFAPPPNTYSIAWFRVDVIQTIPNFNLRIFPTQGGLDFSNSVFTGAKIRILGGGKKVESWIFN